MGKIGVHQWDNMGDLNNNKWRFHGIEWGLMGFDGI